jgi:hypothetical protein
MKGYTSGQCVLFFSGLPGLAFLPGLAQLVAQLVNMGQIVHSIVRWR